MIGKTIKEVWLGAESGYDTWIQLKLANETSAYGVVSGDCCSTSWIENVELPARGFPCTIIACRELELPDMDDDVMGNPTEFQGECIQYYGFSIATDRGELVIDYRNASNGYYGGDISWGPDGPVPHKNPKYNVDWMKYA